MVPMMTSTMVVAVVESTSSPPCPRPRHVERVKLELEQPREQRRSVVWMKMLGKKTNDWVVGMKRPMKMKKTSSMTRPKMMMSGRQKQHEDAQSLVVCSCFADTEQLPGASWLELSSSCSGHPWHTSSYPHRGGADNDHPAASTPSAHHPI